MMRDTFAGKIINIDWLIDCCWSVKQYFSMRTILQYKEQLQTRTCLCCLLYQPTREVIHFNFQNIKYSYFFVIFKNYNNIIMQVIVNQRISILHITVSRNVLTICRIKLLLMFIENAFPWKKKSIGLYF